MFYDGAPKSSIIGHIKRDCKMTMERIVPDFSFYEICEILQKAFFKKSLLNEILGVKKT